MGEAVLPAGIDLVEDPLRPRVGGLAAVRRRGPAGRPARARRRRRADRLDPRPRHRPPARPARAPATPVRGTVGAALPRRRATSRSPKGRVARDGLLAEMGTGLLVTSLIGASINPTTGDYSRGASGFWVENGEIVRPVNECTIAGNLRAMLLTIRPANDARPWLGRVVPSLLVEGLVIAGD